MKKQWSTVLLIALVLVVVIFSVLNVDPVAINFGFEVIEIPLAIMLIGTLLIGVLITAILSTTIIYQNKNEQKRLNKRLEEFEANKKAEKDQLKEAHQEEMQSLEERNEQNKAKVRELERRIQNMQTSQDAKNGEV